MFESQQPIWNLYLHITHFALQFKHLPLYLEWAPAEVFRSASAVPDYRPAATVAATEGEGVTDDKEKDKDSAEVHRSNI